jgi:hypothetical protein
MRNLLLTVCWLIGIQTGYAQINYTWNGSSSTAFSNTANWTPAGVPTSTDNITIVTGSNICMLAGNTTVRNITLNSGQLNLNGNTLTVTGPTATFNAGSVQNGTLTVTGVGTVSFGAGPTTLNCAVNMDAATITLRNATFQGVTTITKTGTSNDWSSGGNTFNDVLTVNNTGTGYFLLGNGNPDVFNAAATFNNTSANNIYVAYNSTNNIFNGPVEFNNAPSANNAIYVSSYSAGTIFNNNITVTSTNGQGILFCNNNTTANATLATGRTINIGPAGFTAGTLQLKQFIQTGATPQSITLTGTGVLQFGPAAAFGGKLVTFSPSLYLNGAVFSDSANFTKTGPNDNNGTGGNIFNGVLTVNNAGAGYLMMGNNSPDTFNLDATFNNIGSNHMYIAHNSTGHRFNGPVTFNNAPATNHVIMVSHYADTTTFNNSITVTSVSGNGVHFCNGTNTATAWLTAGNTVNIGPAGFSSGTLLFRQFTQIGATPQNLLLTGTSRLTFGPTSKFDGNVTTSSPSIFLNGCTFNGATDLTKTGTTGDYNQGGNIFNGVCRITKGGNNFWLLGDQRPDIWNNDVILTNKGSERLLLSWATVGNQFNGDIYINSSDTAAGIQFCGGNSTATAILAAGKTILPGVTGLTAGYLYLKQFTQLGNTVPLNITGTGTSSVILGPLSEFNAPMTVIAPDITPQGATYNAPVVFTKTGGTANNNNQRQNIFNGTVTINQQSSTGTFMLGYNSNELFNDDIIVTSIGTSGIYLGRPNGNSTPVLAAGKTIRVGTDGFSAGSLNIRTFTQLGNAPINLNFTGTNTMLSFSDTSLIGGNVTASIPSIYFGNTRFKGKVNVTKTGTTNDGSRGANNFEDSLTINNTGTGYIQLGNNEADTFYNAVQFNSSGSSYIGAAWNTTGHVFNGNITVTSTGSSTGVYFGNNSGAAATLAAGSTIKVGAAGFTSGTLSVRRFTQNGNALVYLPLTGTASLVLGPSSSFGGNFIGSSPSIYLHGAVYNGTSAFTKTGTTGDYSSGGNIFHGVSSFTNTGSSFFLLGNNSPDIWNDDVTFNNHGSERILPCWATAGNQFNGNIYVNSSGSATGIRFCGGSSSATATLAAGKTIQAGAGGLYAGNLILQQFTQLGNAPVNLVMGGTATYIQYGPASTFGGDVTSSSPGLYFNGCTFNGTVTSAKTGANSDYSSGNNTFNGVTTITNSGSGSLLLGNGSLDRFNTTATFNNTGSANIYVAHSSTSNVFAGVTTFNNTPTANTAIYVSQNSFGTRFDNDVIVTSTNGQGVQFCNSTTASAVLATGRTISIGAGGFSGGTLLLRNFIQLGTVPHNFNLTGTGSLVFGPSSTFNAEVTSTSPTLYYNGCVFNAAVTGTKTGNTSDASSGNNTFRGVATMTNTGSGYLMLGNGNADKFNTTATFNNTGTSHIYVAHNSTGNIFAGVTTFNNSPSNNSGIFVSQNSPSTQFNNDIVVTSTNGQGVIFCNSSTASATLAATYTISIGGAGFSAGQLYLRQFTQTGATAQNLTLTGSSTLQFGPSSNFGGDITSTSPGLLFHSSVFNGVVNSTKNGSVNDQSSGNNTFNAAATFTVTGAGYMMMTNNNPDAYNGNVTFVQTSTGRMYPNYNNNSTYAGNILVTAPATSGIVFGVGNGTATMTGSGTQTVDITAGTPAPSFTRLVIANTGGGVTLNTPISVSRTLTLTSGLLNTTTTNILTMMNNATTAAGDATSTSYVNGPMRYQKQSSGTTTLNFPIGKDADCRPVVLTLNHSNGNLYTYQAELFNASASGLGYTLPPSVDRVSRVHYYTIGRTDASSVNQPTAGLSGNQTIQVFFGGNDFVTDGGQLTIVKNTNVTPTAWRDIGGTGGPTYNGTHTLTGSITSTSAPSAFNSFSTFALANISAGMNLLPVGLLNFDARGHQSQVDLEWATSMEVNNSHFTVEKSRDGVNFTAVQRVNTKAPGGNSSNKITYTATDLAPYSGNSYYRLKQTDINGNVRYSKAVIVSLVKQQQFAAYPNPSTGTLYVSGINTSKPNMTFGWYDAAGKLVMNQTVAVNNGLARLETSLRNGMYLLKFIADDGSLKMQQIIINK